MDHESNRGSVSEIDPVCGMTIEPSTAADHQNYKQHDYYFCSTGCSEKFRDKPEGYL